MDLPDGGRCCLTCDTQDRCLQQTITGPQMSMVLRNCALMLRNWTQVFGLSDGKGGIAVSTMKRLLVESLGK